jgi:hypothetical protein
MFELKKGWIWQIVARIWHLLASIERRRRCWLTPDDSEMRNAIYHIFKRKKKVLHFLLVPLMQLALRLPMPLAGPWMLPFSWIGRCSTFGLRRLHPEALSDAVVGPA